MTLSVSPCGSRAISVSYWFRYNEKIFIHIYLSCSTITLLLPCLPLHGNTLLLVSPWFLLPNGMLHVVLSIPAKYTFHLSSSLNSTFSFSFGSAAPWLPSLPCHFAFSCVFWVITVTPLPKRLLWGAAHSSAWSCCSPPCPRSLISHLKGKLSAKALGFGLLPIWMLFPFNCSVLFGMMYDPYFSYPRIISLRKTNRSNNKYSRT